MMHALGWREFLRGPLLCPECSDDPDRVDRAVAPIKMVLQALSPQQQRVIESVALGKTNAEIGADMGLSEKTVKNYLAEAMERLGIHRRAGIAAYVVKKGIHETQDDRNGSDCGSRTYAPGIGNGGDRSSATGTAAAEGAIYATG